MINIVNFVTDSYLNNEYSDLSNRSNSGWLNEL